MCVLEHNFFLCSSYDSEGVSCLHYDSEIIDCKDELQCRKKGIPPEMIRYKLHFEVCGSAHCSMSMYWKAEHNEINCATWALNTDCNKSYRATKLSARKKEEDEKMDEIVIENTNEVDRAEAIRAIRWMERQYPEQLAQIRQQVMAGYVQGVHKSTGQSLTKMMSKEEQEVWADADELNRREWQAQQAQQAQLQAHAQQYAYQHQYPNHHQIQYHPDQYQPQAGYYPYQATLPSSSSGHYLPPPNPTLYLTASDDYNGHDGYAGIPGVAGLLTAPPSADEAPRSKSGSSSSRSKDTSKHGKTEKKGKPEREDKGKTGGKEKKRR